MQKIGLALVLMLPLVVRAELDVFACEPEWAALATEIGKEKVTAYSATTAQQDPHYIQARPSLIAKVRKAYENLRPIPCTKCGYCMPCPSGLNIPRNLDLYNIAVMYNQKERSRKMYQNMKEENNF